MKALVLEKKRSLSLRDIGIDEELGPDDVRVSISHVGICGSDIHYYLHGRIGPFAVEEPMILGHEASGVVEEVGTRVGHLAVGDRVCMEPGIPRSGSRAVMRGHYNLDPDVRFWATPPIHGVLRPSVVHPAAFTFKLPSNLELEVGALTEPFATGVHAVAKSGLKLGDLAVVCGAGPIGLLTAIAALSAGAAHVIISDVSDTKLDMAASLGPITPVNVSKDDLNKAVDARSDGWGANVIFEASGAGAAFDGLFELASPAGKVVLIGMPGEPVRYDVVAAQVREVTVEHVFRYANIFPAALATMGNAAGSIERLITHRFAFDDALAAFEFAAQPSPDTIKVMIEM